MKGRALSAVTFEHKRDAYGFAVRPQHVQRYREYAIIYKEEEEERSERWNAFLEQQAESGFFHGEEASNSETVVEADGSGDETKTQNLQMWTHIRPSLHTIEHVMNFRVKKKKYELNNEQHTARKKHPVRFEESEQTNEASEEDSEDEFFYDVERTDSVNDASSSDGDVATNLATEGPSPQLPLPWKEELECLIHGGVPMALRGELWQAFVGVRTRRVEGYYQNLLSMKNESSFDNKQDSSMKDNATEEGNHNDKSSSERWKVQIEKDLPRTFPGHPALDEDGRNALRRLLTAYAHHNPAVGYCQAMNFFAGLLRLLMPEENAFWTLLAILDDYFDRYYTEDMTESQVDQLVLEELVRERFPKLVSHLDYLGVQVVWVTGPWFLSIFVNILPWESVLRVWDVLLFEGNRLMLFRTALAMLELYGPALLTTKDAGDAVTLLQSLAGSTFDSSQLVLTACMGCQFVNEAMLEQLRMKHRPAVCAIVEERANGVHILKDFHGLASKLYNFIPDPQPLITELDTKDGSCGLYLKGDDPDSVSLDMNGFLKNLTRDAENDSVPNLEEQVVWLKVELCRLLEEKRSATLRAEELETALMEMVKQDNRRQLSAKAEELEEELAVLRRALADKLEQEQAMLQVLIKVEQEQKVAEDARLFAEQDAAAQRYALEVLQEKYEKAMISLAEMEKRVVMAETTLEATLQYQTGQIKMQPSPSPSPRATSSDSPPARVHQENQPDSATRKISLLSRSFNLGWRDRNKSNTHASLEKRTTNTDDSTDFKATNGSDQPILDDQLKAVNGRQA